MLIKNLLAVLLLSALLAVSASPRMDAPAQPHLTAQQPARLQEGFGRLPVYFVTNQGQVDDRVAYYIQGCDKTIYFTPQGLTFALDSSNTSDRLAARSGRYRTGSAGWNRWVVKLDFVGANHVVPISQAQTETIISYFKGPQEEWHTGLPTYSRVVYPGLWPGIDLVYSGTVNRLKYEFVVQPGADPDHIHLVYRGAAVRLNQAGQLVVSTPVGGFRDDAPVAYQQLGDERLPVQVRFDLSGSGDTGYRGARSYGFHLGAYDPNLPLVIDPAVLVYSGFIGGDDSDWAYGIVVDSEGYAYVTGETSSTETTFPETVGPDLDFNGGTMDAYVAKVKADGTGLVYTGYIGGDESDVGRAIAVDTVGNAYIAGETDSTEASFPVLVGPDLGYNGGFMDAFVAKVKVDGTGLLYAGYIGGNGWEVGSGIAVDTAGSAYVTGVTNSTQATFPVLIGPDLAYSGSNDAFVVKVAVDGTALVYAGYVGGESSDDGKDIAVDSGGSAYITGCTASTEATFPASGGPDTIYNGGTSDAYVAKVRADGVGFVYSGYIGGLGFEEGHGIKVDMQGSAYIAGITSSLSSSFPEIVGPDLTFNGGGSDAFVAKVANDGLGLIYAGYIGGDDFDQGYAIALDSVGNAYVTGYAFSTETTFPVIGGPDLTHNGGYWDAFVAMVRADGVGLVYCGYIGGDSTDEGLGIAVDTAGNAFVVGVTKSDQSTLPVSVGPDLTFNGDRDAFIARVTRTIDLYLPLVIR